MIKLPVPGDNRILFYSGDPKDFGFLSHFHPAAASARAQ
jgi:hypothetical protein